MNPITVYMAGNIIDFEKLALRIVGGDVRPSLDHFAPGLGELAIAIVGLAIALLLCRVLYERKVFLRL